MSLRASVGCALISDSLNDSSGRLALTCTFWPTVMRGCWAYPAVANNTTVDVDTRSDRTSIYIPFGEEGASGVSTTPRSMAELDPNHAGAAPRRGQSRAQPLRSGIGDIIDAHIRG